MNDKTHTGGCMCGAVRYEVEGESDWNGFCHCHSCRSHTGAPVVAFVTFRPERIKWTKGERAKYESSPGKFRAFCRDCGTPLTWEAKRRDPPEMAGLMVIEFHISTLDNPDAFKPTEHVFHGERIAWFDTSDDLPRYVATPD